MYYLPLKKKESITHIAKSIDKAVDKILTENGRIMDMDLKQLFSHVNFLKICTYEMYDDKDFLLDMATADKDPVFNLSTSELLNSRNQDLIWVFVHNLQDLMELTKELDAFSQLNQYIYEVLNSDRN